MHTQDAQPEELESVLRTALRDPHLRVGMLVPGTSGFVDASGDPVPDNGLVPVTLGGVQIGVLSGSDATGPGVLRVVASACASLVEVTRLRAELAGALREVEASRTRLVQVGDAERRRLERDLHDGAQQRLVSLGMAMRLAQRRLPQGGVDVNELLDQGVAELATAIAELRQIAHGLRPTSLDDGLHAALSALTGKLPIPVHLDVVPEPLDDDVATTAYFVAAEAITNAAKYANASAINVRVAQSSTGVEVRVQDDGIGGAAARTGSGTGRAGRPGRGHRWVADDDQPGGRGHHDRGGAAVRIVIGEDSALFREGLASLLVEAGHDIVGRAADAETLLDVVTETQPDLAHHRRTHAARPHRRRRPGRAPHPARPTPAWPSCCSPSTWRPSTPSSW